MTDTTPPAPRDAGLLRPVSARAKGVVDPATAQRTFRLNRYEPAPDLAAVLDYHWIVEWDLRGQPDFVQRTLPYPVVNIVFDAELTAVFGVVSGAYEHRLTGANRALGLRFRPGGFRALLKRGLHTITDVHLPLSAVLPVDDAEAERAVLGQPDDAGMIAAAEAMLRPLLGPPDPKVDRLNAILALAQNDPALTRVDELAERAGVGMRALQAWFSDYIGVSPKWVIRRYRLHEAADQLAHGADLDLADLAQRLGYYDQAHFTRDFSRLVGRPPQAYRRPAAAPPR